MEFSNLTTLVGRCGLLQVISKSEGWQSPSCLSHPHNPLWETKSLNQSRNSLFSVALRCSLLIHSNPTLDLILGQILFTPCFFKIHSNIILMCTSSKWSTPFMFPDHCLYRFLISSVSHHIMLLFIKWINRNFVTVVIEQAQ